MPFRHVGKTLRHSHYESSLTGGRKAILPHHLAKRYRCRLSQYHNTISIPTLSFWCSVAALWVASLISVLLVHWTASFRYPGRTVPAEVDFPRCPPRHDVDSPFSRNRG